MEYPYKLSLKSDQLNKDFVVAVSQNKVLLGNTVNCDARFSKDIIDIDVEIELVRNSSDWVVGVNEGLYVEEIHNTITGDIKNSGLKTRNFDAECGDVFLVYANDKVLFELSLIIDFEASLPKINNYVSLDGFKNITVSSDEGAELIIISPYGVGNEITISNTGSDYVLSYRKAPFGVYVNKVEVHENVRLRDYDYITFADVAVFFRDGKLFFDKATIKSNAMLVETVHNEGIFQYPGFIRNTRIKKKINEDKIKILDPSNKPEQPDSNILTRLLPAIIMLGLCIVFRAVLNPSKSTFVIFSICSMGMGIITSVVGIVKGKKKYSKNIIARRENYIRYIEEKRADIADMRQQELEALKDRYYSTQEDLDHILSFDTCLFDRDKTDAEFLDTYLGTGSRKAIRIIDYKEKEQLTEGDELTKLPKQLFDTFEYIDEAPITINLREAGAVGVTGSKEAIFDVFANMIIDICARQYYSDVKIVCLVDQAGYKKGQYDFLKYLPHIQMDNSGDNTQRFLVIDEESKTTMFDYLYKMLTNRESGKDATPHYVIFALDDYGIRMHPLMKYVETANEKSATFIFFKEKVQKLPQYCRYVVELEGNKSGYFYNTLDSDIKTSFVYDYIDSSKLMDMSMQLAPIYTEEISLSGDLRKKYSIYEMLDIFEINDLDIGRRWKESQVCKSLATPLGINAKGEKVYLDIHEKYHGPHGLVAGTTGSGKSEILQSYILGMATLYAPSEVGFLIIDFKGGGMANLFKALPHLMGAITNIEGSEVDRSLKSIKAELIKRQELFAAADVNHIDKYIELYKNGECKIPLPHLIIVVDEFAELKAEQPEFMKELISAARIGRSLGVHLILATQKPAGQVNEQIWSNSKFKLCLKVQTQADSNEVLKSPLAAEIREPGRAYLQVGNNEIFELFQSGYSGELENQLLKQERAYKMYEVDFKGNSTVVFEKKASASKEARTQLKAIIDKICEHCENNNIKKLDPICMQSLPEEIEYTRKAYIKGISIGIYDAPDKQQQLDYCLDIFGGNTLIIGASGMGKTVLLQNIIRNINDIFSAEEANIYICDFGSMYLKNFELLNIVGGTVTIDDDERFKNFMKLLQNELYYRKSRLSSAGTSNIDAYLEAGHRDIARIVVLIDNFALYKEVYDATYGENMLQLMRDGISCGITFVITNTQPNGVGYKYLPNFANRIAFSINDGSGYAGIFDRCRMKPKEVPGRALCVVEKEIYEMQVYNPFAGDTETKRTNEIRDYVGSSNQKSSRKARRIPEVPENLTLDYLQDILNKKITSGVIPVGLDYETMKLVSFSGRKSNEMCIFGDDTDRKADVISRIINCIHKLYNPEKTRIIVIDSIEKSLKKLADNVDEYTCVETDAIPIFEGAYAEAKARYEQYVSDVDNVSFEDAPYILIVNSQECAETVSASKELIAQYKELLKKYRKMGVYFIFSFLEDASIPYNSCEIVKGLKEHKNAICVTENIKEVKLIDVNSGTAKTLKNLERDNAYCFIGSSVYRLKLIN